MKRRANRRRFLGALGVAGLGAAVAPSALIARAVAASQPKPRAAKPPAAAKPVAPADPNAPPPPSDDARALAEIVRRRYGAHLSPEQLEGVTRELEQRLGGGRALRAAKLANGDEPDATFHA